MPTGRADNDTAFLMTVLHMKRARGDAKEQVWLVVNT